MKILVQNIDSMSKEANLLPIYMLTESGRELGSTICVGVLRRLRGGNISLFPFAGVLMSPGHIDYWDQGGCVSVHCMTHCKLNKLKTDPSWILVKT